MDLRLPMAGCVLAIIGCTRDPRSQAATSERLGDGGVRIRSVAEVPPLGSTANGTELDVPLAWMHLIAEPVPTGGAPNVAVGARIPCGYEPFYAASDKHDDVVRVRIRARRIVGDAVDARCNGPRETVHIVSLGVLRLGTYTVVDAVAHSPEDPPAPSAVLHVIQDDAEHLAPALVRWTRPCDQDADCTAGGVCARVATTGVCLAPADPWLAQGQTCPRGTSVTEATHGTPPTAATWRACMGHCESGHPCPVGYGCASSGVCVPTLRRRTLVDGG